MSDLTITAEVLAQYPIPYFSYSQLSSYRSCPQTYYLTYLSPDKERKGNKYTELGGILHEIFEWEGKQRIFKKNYVTIEKAIAQFNKVYMNLRNDPIKKAYFDDKDDFIAMYQKGIKALTNYFELYADQPAPVFVEREFKGVIAEGLPPAKGFVDRIDGEKDDPSTWVLTDYKTGGSPKSKQYLREDFQMGLYVAMVYAEFGVYPQAVKFVHPVPSKTQTAVHIGDGVYEFTNQRKPVVTFSVADTIVLIKETIADIVRAVKENDFPLIVDSWGCKNCFFFQDGTCKPFDKVQTGWAKI